MLYAIFLLFFTFPPKAALGFTTQKKSGAKVYAHTFAPLSYIFFLEIVFCGHLQTLSHAVHDAVGGLL